MLSNGPVRVGGGYSYPCKSGVIYPLSLKDPKSAKTVIPKTATCLVISYP